MHGGIGPSAASNRAVTPPWEAYAAESGEARRPSHPGYNAATTPGPREEVPSQDDYDPRNPYAYGGRTTTETVLREAMQALVRVKAHTLAGIVKDLAASYTDNTLMCFTESAALSSALPSEWFSRYCYVCTFFATLFSAFLFPVILGRQVCRAIRRGGGRLPGSAASTVCWLLSFPRLTTLLRGLLTMLISRSSSSSLLWVLLLLLLLSRGGAI